LDEKSQKYCCLSPFGCFKFLTLPFGLVSAPEKFQELTSKYFGGIQNVDVYCDDVLVSGVNKEEHDKALDDIIKIAKMLNIKFNSTKL